jgi:hypothetical protein
MRDFLKKAVIEAFGLKKLERLLWIIDCSKLALNSFVKFLLYGCPLIATRRDFPHVLNRFKLLGKGCEIGVRRGEYSAYLLSIWKGLVLYSIDPWLEMIHDTGYIDTANVDQRTHDLFFDETKRSLSRFGSRSWIIRKLSVEILSDFDDDSLDFVYIDARHDYGSVYQDINNWFQKVKKRGFIGGHDYFDGVFPIGVFGVKSAVDNFAKERKLKLIITFGFSESERSWFILKP